MASHPPLITDDDLAMVEEEIAVARRGQDRSCTTPSLPKAKDFIQIQKPTKGSTKGRATGGNVPTLNESQDSVLPLPAFLIRREDEALPPSRADAQPPGKMRERAAPCPPLPEGVRGGRTISPYHVAWALPTLATLNCLFLDRAPMLVSLMMAAGMVWALFLDFALAARAERECLSCLRTTTVIQVVIASMVLVDWTQQAKPDFGIAEWIAVFLTLLMAAGMFVLESGSDLRTGRHRTLVTPRLPD